MAPAEADLAQVELGPALAELLVVKEDKEVSCVKRAAIFSAVVMQKSLVKRIEDCIEEDKKEKHSILADETEKAFAISLYQMEIDRIQYLLASYLRTRLAKVQQQAQLVNTISD